MLDETEIQAAWEAYWADRGNMEALDLLVRNYAQLAAYHARRAMAKAPAHQDPEELLSFAHHGLLSAIERFRPDGGAKFETYATRRIPGAIIDGQRKLDPLARDMRHRVKILDAARNELWDSLQRDPSVDELALHLHEEPARVREVLMFRESMPIELAESHDSEGAHHEGEMLVRMAEIRSQVAGRLSQLQGSRRAFVLAYYLDELSLKDACIALGISNDWGRKTRLAILESLRS